MFGAGLDLILAAFEYLMYPLVVNEILTRDGDSVELAGGDLLGGLDRVHTAGADDGLGGIVLYMLDIAEVAVIGHVLRRMRPVPCVVGAVVAVEHIVACVGKILNRALGLLHVTAELLEVLLIRHCALAPVLGLGDDGVAQGDGEVTAALALDGLNDLDRETVAVLEGAAVLVGTVVHVGDGELVKQIALVDGVDLNTVDPGFLEELGGLCKGFDLIVYLLDGHGAGLDLVIPAVRRGRSGGGDIVKVGNGAGYLAEQRVLEQEDHGLCDGHGAAHARGELDKQLCAGLMELLHIDLQILEHLLVLIQPAAADGVLDALHAGQDQADAVLGAVEQEIRGFLIEVARLHPAEQGRAAHGALDDAVLDLHIAHLPRRKQGFILGIH